MAAKVLGQVAPAASTATTLYAVPSAKAAVVSSLVVCNLGTVSGTYRIAVRPAAAALAAQHYLAYDAVALASESDPWTIGITLAETDVVTVYASSANFSFSLFGDES